MYNGHSVNDDIEGPIISSRNEELQPISDERILEDDEESLLLPRSRRTSSILTGSMQRIRTATLNSIHSLHDFGPQQARTTSTVGAGWSIANLIQGIGILGIPYAIAQGSWMAVALTVVIAAACCFTGCLLIECLYDEDEFTGRRYRVYNSYPCLGEAVWPKFGRVIVSVVSVVEMFGGVVLYIILLARTSSAIITPLIPALNINYCAILATYAVLPLLLVNRMNIIAWFSLIAVVGLISTISLIIGYCLSEVGAMSLSNMPDFDITRFPVSVGIIVFSYTAHVVFPPVENSMKKPEQYPVMLVVAFTIAAVIKTLMGVTAVLIYGFATQQEVTGNLESNPVIKIVVSILVFMNVFFSLPLVMHVVNERFDTTLLHHFHPVFQQDGRLHKLWIGVTRVTLLTTGLFIAMLVPHFATLMGLVGSFTGTCLCFLFPSYFHLKLKWNKITKFGVALRVMIIVVGFVAGGFGVVFSTMRLVDTFRNDQ